MKKTYFSSFNKAIKSLNNSKFFAGIIMIVMNIGSRFVTIKFSKSTENYIRYGVSKQLLLFSMSWMATRDIYISLSLTAIFTILSEYLFNEESKMCVVPENYRILNNLIDEDQDSKISEDELNKAISILQKANQQSEQLKQKTIYAEYFHNK
jgi:hypothetical protein